MSNIVSNLFYSTGTAGIIGAIGAKAGGMISQKIESINPLKLVSKMIPQCAKDSLKTGLLPRTLGICNAKIGEFLGGSNLLLSRKLSSIIGAPIVEEVVFRTGIQQLLTYCLSCGTPLEAAEITSVFLSNIMFSMAHGRELESIEGTELWLKGTAYSLAYNLGGLGSSIIAHALNNARQFMPSLSELFSNSESSALNDFSEIVAMNKRTAAPTEPKDIPK